MKQHLCKKCQRLLIGFVDEANASDAELSLITALCEVADDSEFPAGRVLRELGSMLRHRLAKNRVLRHFFLGEPLGPWVEEGFAVGELARLTQLFHDVDEKRRGHGRRLHSSKSPKRS